MCILHYYKYKIKCIKLRMIKVILIRIIINIMSLIILKQFFFFLQLTWLF